MKNLGVGLLLTVFGMGTTFIALSLVILSSKILGRLFPFKEVAEEEEEEIGGAGEQIMEWSALESEEIPKAEPEDSSIREALLTAAVTAYLQGEEIEEPHFTGRVTSPSVFPSSSWKMEGRRELFSSRKISGRWKKK